MRENLLPREKYTFSYGRMYRIPSRLLQNFVFAHFGVSYQETKFLWVPF